MERSRIAIIIPAYNEEKTIGQVIQASLEFGQVIVVNDCSSDKTEFVSKEAGAIVVSHVNNKGYDGALSTGLKKAVDLGCETAITIDADGQHDPELLKKFIDELNENEENSLVVGVRDKQARFSEKAMGQYFKFRFGMRDPLCGLKAYRLNDVERFEQFDCIGTDLAFFLVKNGKRFSQIDIIVKDRLDQPRFGSLFKANMKIFKALTKTIVRDIVN
jgi:glycosyltransferase involved in cell wall biosynthesis